MDSWGKKNLKVDMYPLHFIAIFPKFLGTFKWDQFCQRTDIESKCLVCDDIIDNFGMY